MASCNINDTYSMLLCILSKLLTKSKVTFRPCFESGQLSNCKPAYTVVLQSAQTRNFIYWSTNNSSITAGWHMFTKTECTWTTVLESSAYSSSGFRSKKFSSSHTVCKCYCLVISPCRLVDTLKAHLDQYGIGLPLGQLTDDLSHLPADLTIGQAVSTWKHIVLYQHKKTNVSNQVYWVHQHTSLQQLWWCRNNHELP